MLPNSTPKASKDIIVQALIDQGLWSNDRIGKLSVVGVRGYYNNSMGEKNINDRGIYDDGLFIISPDTFTAYNGNTDPSAQYKTGCAMLRAPQRVVYKPGYHGYGRRSGHPAFRQRSNAVVRRDGGVGNGTPLGDGYFQDSKESRFWINLHRGGRTTTSAAGCQTLPSNQWPSFYSLVRLQLDRHNGGKDSAFSYYLIEGPVT